MNDPLVLQAFDLVVYGMGTVFVFLTVLVGCTMLMSSILYQAPDAEDISDEDPAMLAAIAAAVHRHRENQNKP